MANPIKTAENSQWGRISLTGIHSFPGLANGASEPLVDEFGRVWTRNIPPPTPFPTAPNQAQINTAPGLISQFQLAAIASIVGNVSGINTSAAIIFAQLHNTVAVLAGGEVPVISILVPPLSTFSISSPYVFGTGIRIASSTTPSTFTSTAAIMWAQALYYF